MRLNPFVVRLVALAALPVALVSAQQPARKPLSAADIGDIATLVRLEDTRELDEAALGQVLRSANADVRRRAVMAIGRIAKPAGGALLTAVRADPDPAVVAAVAFATGQLKDPATIAWLDDLLMSPKTTPDVAREAARSLGKIAVPEARAVLAKYLSSAPDTQAARPPVGEALLSIGRSTTRGDLAPIVRWSKSDPEVRWRAAWALYRPRDPAAVPELLRLSADSSAEVRFWAMRGLGPLPAGRGRDGAPAAPEPTLVEPSRLSARLREGVRDPDRRVRTEALRALALYDDDESFKVVADALGSNDTWMSVSAAENMGRFTTRAAVVVPRLVEAAAPAKPLALRITALTPLTALAPEAALDAAATLARESSATARMAARQALGRLGDAGRARLDALAKDNPEFAAAPAATPRPPTPARTAADYQQVVERWIVPDYNGAPRPRAILETPKGQIEVELNPGDAPLGVEYFVSVVTSGAIVGTEFGRVVPNFVAQQRAIRANVRLRDEVNRHRAAARHAQLGLCRSRHRESRLHTWQHSAAAQRREFHRARPRRRRHGRRRSAGARRSDYRGTDEVVAVDPRLRRITFAEVAAVLAGAVTLAAVSTWPLVAMFGTGGRFENNDAYFSVWRIAWMARTLVVDPLHVFNANIFAPHNNTLAYSESTVGLGVLAAPVYWATGNPIAAHNAIVLLAFITSAVCAYFLARHLTNSRAAAAIAAILFAQCPYVFGRLSHIHLLFTAGLPLSLLAFHRWVEVPKTARAVALGVALFATSATSGYYGIFAGVSVGLAWVFYAISGSRWRVADYWIGGVVAVGTWALLMLPLYWPHWLLRQNQFERSLDDARLWSADWPSYFASSAWAHRWMLPVVGQWGQWNDILFPGFVVTLLALAGAAQLRSKGSVAPRETLGFYITLAGLALWMSFGPKAGLYTVVFHVIPLFSWMRAPSRFAVVFVLALAMLAGFGVEWLVRRRSKAVILTIGAGLAVLACVELATFPLPLSTRPIPAIYDTLAKLPRGVVAEFPFYADRQSYHAHTLYMFYSTRHWQPMLNGYSDYIPPDFRRLATKLATFPDDESIAMLRARDARYVVVHRALYPDAQREALTRALETSPDLRPIAGDPDNRLFELLRER